MFYLHFVVDLYKKKKDELPLFSFDQGAAVIRMLERVVGADIFNKALRSYLTKHQYANAETDDLWKSFTSEVTTYLSICAQVLNGNGMRNYSGPF